MISLRRARLSLPERALPVLAMKGVFADPADLALPRRGSVTKGGLAAGAGSRSSRRERAEDTLRHETDFMKTALDNLSQGLCIYGPDARLVFCNEEYRRMYGLDAAIVRPGCALHDDVAARAAERTLGRDADLYCREFLARVAQGESFSQSHRTADDRIVETTHQPIASGGWISTHQDITKRRRAEAALRKNEHVLQNTFDHMAEGISIFDADLNLVAANSRYRELLGIPEALARPGTPLADILRHRAGRGDYGACDVEE
jgi:PAS domain-containing protein